MAIETNKTKEVHSTKTHSSSETTKTAPTMKTEEKKDVKTQEKVGEETKKEVKGKATEIKAEEKKDSKGKEEKKEPKVVKKKFIPFVKKKNEKKSDKAKAMMKVLAEKKKGHPTFRGRFGKQSIRRIKLDKWNKWRKPHGIDLDKGLQHGFRPKTGYRNACEIRGVHPSGYREIMVCNVNDLSKINPQTEAARVSAVVGKRKKNEIVTKANEKKIWVLN